MRGQQSWKSRHTAPHCCVHSVCWNQRTLHFQRSYFFPFPAPGFQPLYFVSFSWLANSKLKCKRLKTACNPPKRAVAMEDDFRRWRKVWANPSSAWQAKTAPKRSVQGKSSHLMIGNETRREFFKWTEVFILHKMSNISSFPCIPSNNVALCALSFKIVVLAWNR